MFLKRKDADDLIKISDVETLFDPTASEIVGKVQAGQNEQPETTFQKAELIFPSGETLPQCWTDANYRMNMPAEPQPG
ncbi:MAG: acetyltransferase [Cyanobacteria bacterium P01_A01_bin.135]